MPNDVYRKALTLRREVELLGVWFGVDTDVRESVAEPGRTPEDVYRLAEGIIVRLRRIVTGSLELDILGGVAQPLASPETVEPADVLDLMHLVLAELNAVKAAAGIDDPTWLPGKQVGRTPSDVFGVLSQADSMLARIERRVEKS
jgi:hypothetical protein